VRPQAVFLLAVLGFAPGAARDNGAAPEAVAFCAQAGDAIDVAVAPTSPSGWGGLAPPAILLAADARPLASLTGSWRAPYTGLYYARAGASAAGDRASWRVLATVNGLAAAGEPADLTVTQVGSPSSASPGDQVTFTVMLVNNGPSFALDATILDPLPAGMAFVTLDVSPADGSWECTTPKAGANGKVSCTDKCLSPGGSATFTIVASVEYCIGNVVAMNVASASSDANDPNASDNTAIALTTVTDPRTCDDGNVCTSGDACGPGAAFTENFDGLLPPLLPPGWTSTVLIGPASGTWKTVTTAFDTGPNGVFAPDASEIRDVVLDSPGVLILTPTAQLKFMNQYNLEYRSDGGVLEMRIGSGPYIDILDAGGHFESGGYDATILGGFQSPITGRQAWTGDSGGFRPTVVDLPAASVGQTVVFRWRLATDKFLGLVGQWIDTVEVTGPDTCLPGTTSPCDDNDPCTVDSCDPVAGCTHVPISCDDGNPCTDDSCNGTTQCVHTNNSAACDDGNACTRTDICLNGACVGLNPIVCTPATSCDVAACDAAAGCVTATANLDTSGFSAQRVDGRDLAVLAAAWNSCPGSPQYNAAANLDPSGACIDGADFHAFMQLFGTSCTP
jgi:uncharacterized repeat protein (TIGR01451 family)